MTKKGDVPKTDKLSMRSMSISGRNKVNLYVYRELPVLAAN